MSLAEQLTSAVGLPERLEGRDMFRSGLTLAKVTNIKDEQNLNRVKCLPIGVEATEETDWCYVMMPMGGAGCGSFFFPQVNDLVVLTYLDGDPHRPLVLGGFWNTEVKPPLTIKDGKIADCEFTTYEPDGTLKDSEYGKQDGEVANQDFYNKAQRAVQASSKYAENLVNAGNLADVDKITGASISYKEFQEAVNDALDQAQGK